MINSLNHDLVQAMSLAERQKDDPFSLFKGVWLVDMVWLTACIVCTSRLRVDGYVSLSHQTRVLGTRTWVRISCRACALWRTQTMLTCNVQPLSASQKSVRNVSCSLSYHSSCFWSRPIPWLPPAFCNEKLDGLGGGKAVSWERFFRITFEGVSTCNTHVL